MAPGQFGTLSNRADCYLRLARSSGPAARARKFERLRKAIADCNLALSRPGCGRARDIRARLLRCRGDANALLGQFAAAISDHEVFTPKNIVADCSNPSPSSD